MTAHIFTYSYCANASLLDSKLYAGGVLFLLKEVPFPLKRFINVCSLALFEDYQNHSSR